VPVLTNWQIAEQQEVGLPFTTPSSHCSGGTTMPSRHDAPATSLASAEGMIAHATVRTVRRIIGRASSLGLGLRLMARGGPE